ncbi:hypothetical protein GF358_00275 [Candidatus Woesearchaeota archaeon]|nr:hypothetical protein [Candidatus Woesearchaeota archaeon]
MNLEDRQEKLFKELLKIKNAQRISRKTSNQDEEGSFIKYYNLNKTLMHNIPEEPTNIIPDITHQPIKVMSEYERFLRETEELIRKINETAQKQKKYSQQKKRRIPTNNIVKTMALFGAASVISAYYLISNLF